MTQKTSTDVQWSRQSWLTVFGAVLAIFLAWWPVVFVLKTEVFCRYFVGAGLAYQYILLVGVPSWVLALVIAGSRRANQPSHQLERWIVFTVCTLPLPVSLSRIPVLIAQIL